MIEPRWRAALRRFITHPYFERIVIAVIILNAVTLGLETSKSVMASFGTYLTTLDHLIVAFFVAELIPRLLVHGWRFWRDPWNVFDFLVVAITLAPATGNLSILRGLRILRALRLISAIPSMRRVVASLLSAIPSMGTVILMILLITYIFAVMSTKMFGSDFEQNFGTLGASFYTYFQIMTLDGWSSEIVRPVMEKHPWAWLVFVPYIVLVTFMVLNLFIGIVVDAMNQQNQATAAAAVDQLAEIEHADTRRVLAELAAIRADIARLKSGHSSAEGANVASTPQRQQSPARRGKRRRK